MSDNFEGAQTDHFGVKAIVKWYSPIKGFGFLQRTDGQPDAFLHVSVVQQSGFASLPEGATVTCDLADRDKGTQVTAIHEVDTSTAAPVEDGGDEAVGTVKFYNGQKGFGFVSVDDGGKDVFVSARMLERCGLSELEPEMRVRLWTKMGPKGPMASKLEVI